MARDPYTYFRIEGRELADKLAAGALALEKRADPAMRAQLLRLAHTLKGAARVVRLSEIAGHAHAIEEALGGTAASVSEPGAIDTVLELIDRINAGIATLDTPSNATATPIDAVAVTTQPVARRESEDLDLVLRGIGATQAQVAALEGSVRTATELRSLVDAVSLGRDQSGNERAGGTAHAAMMGLRDHVGRLDRGLGRIRERLERDLAHLRELAEQMRLVPAQTLFLGFERTARDIASTLGKDVVVAFSGGDMRLDAGVARTLQDALTQLIRNAVAHGIEPPAQRQRAGKPGAGRVTLSVGRDGARLLFVCADDGAGIDVDALRDAALRNGQSSDALAGLDGEGLLDALLRGGVTTAQSVTEIAGRGIGMDIVRDTVAQLGGTLRASTAKGQGTRFELSVPATLAALDTLAINDGALSVRLPLGAVERVVRLAPDQIQRGAQSETIAYADEMIPLVPLALLLGLQPALRPGPTRLAIVVAVDGARAALDVTAIGERANIVVRQPPALAFATALVSGIAMDGAGVPALVLDPAETLARARETPNLTASEGTASVPILVIDDSLTTRMLEQSILESAGYRVDIAVSGEDGLIRARAGDYALILVDVEMPGMDGFTFVETIRRDPALRKTPAILVTSRNAIEDRQRGLSAGAQGYVVKSEFDQAQLLDQIQRLVA